MSRVILIDPCLDPRWDRFVENHPFGWITHLSAWKRVLESTFSHMQGHYLALLDGKGEIQAGLPLFEVRSPITGNRLVSIPFATLCDPLVEDQESAHALLGMADHISSRLRCRYTEIRCHRKGDVLALPGINTARNFVNHYLELNGSSDEIFRSFHLTSVKQVLKRSARLGLERRIAQNEKEAKGFYKLYMNTRLRLGLPPQPWNFFKNLFKHLGPSRVCIQSAYLDNTPQAAVMLFKYKDRTSWEAVGMTEKARKLGVPHFLLWEAIKDAKQEGKKIFDLGRTALDNHGLMTFKNRWGTKVVDLPQYYMFNGKKPGRKDLLASYIPYLRRICSRLPMSIFELLGRACYKHMG